MLVSDWMTKKVITITPDKSLLTCRKMFKQNNIHRLPVVDADNRLLGIISATNLKTFSPTLPSGMQVLETIDTLAETTVGDVMVRDVLTISANDTIEQAALAMYNDHVASLIVVDDDRHVIGLITAIKVFRAVLTISGAIQRGEEMSFILPNVPGSLKAVLDILRGLPVRIVSVLSSLPEGDTRSVKIRYRPQKDGDSVAVDAVIARFRDYPGIRYWTRDGEVTLKEGEA